MSSTENNASDLLLPHGNGSSTHHRQEPAEFDRKRVRELVGKTLLIGVDYLSNDGELLEQKQPHFRTSFHPGIPAEVPSK